MKCAKHLRIAAVFALGLGALALPASEDTDFFKANQLYTLHEFKDAAAQLEAFLAAHPSSERAGQARLLLAESRYQLKEYDRAAEAFEKFLDSGADAKRRGEARQRAVKAYCLAKNYDKSLVHADAYLKENAEALAKPDAPPALPQQFASVLYWAGEAAYALKKPERARGYWARLGKEFPKSPYLGDASEGLGWIAFEAKDYAAAQQHFARTAAAPGHPKAASSQVMAARCLEKQDKFDEALAELAKVSALPGGKEPDRARDVALWKALALLHAKRYEQALPAFDALVKGFADHPDAAAAVAEAVNQAQDAGKSSEAEAFAAKYLSAFPKGPERAAIARARARALIALKRGDDALAAAKAALAEADAVAGAEAKVERPAALMLLAECEGDAGAPHLEAVVKEAPGSLFAAAAAYRLALLKGKQNDGKAALEFARTALKSAPDGDGPNADLRTKALFAAADFAFALEDFAAAAGYLDEYLKRSEVSAEPKRWQRDFAQLRLGWCYFKRGDFAGAEQALGTALEAAEPGDVRTELRYLRGRARLKQKKIAEAVTDYEALAKEAPAADFTAHGCYDAAEALFAEGKPGAALPWLDRLVDTPAFSKHKLRGDAQLLRAQARYDTKAFDGATADADALLAAGNLGERAVAVRFLKAAALQAQDGKSEEAEKAYGELVDAGPETAKEVRWGRMARGRMRFQAKKYADAAQDFEAYLGKTVEGLKDQESIDAALLLAVCKREAKDAEGAAALLEKLQNAKLQDAAAFEVALQLGNLAYEAKKDDEAAAQYRKALKAAEALPGLPAETRTAAWMNLAWCLKRAEKLDEAETAFAGAAKADPKSAHAAEARYQRGWLLAKTGNPGAAMGVWKEFLEQNAGDALAPKVLAALGRTQALEGLFKDAAASFDDFLTRFPKEEAETLRDVQCGLGECKLQLNDADGARAAFVKALGGKPAEEAALDEIGERAVLGLAELALAKGEADGAKKLALRVILDRPNSKWLDSALFLCAKANEDLAEPSKAIAYYRELLKARPDSPRAEKVRERLKALGAPASE